MLEDQQELKLHQVGWRTISVSRPQLIIPLSTLHLTQSLPHQHSLLFLIVFILPLLIHYFFLHIWHICLKTMWLHWLVFYKNQNQSIIHRLSNILSGKWPWTMNLLHWNRTTHGFGLAFPLGRRLLYLNECIRLSTSLMARLRDTRPGWLLEALNKSRTKTTNTSSLQWPSSQL